MLASALGRRDGKVYETLFEWASTKNSINSEAFLNKINKEILQLKHVVPQPKL